MLLLVSGMGGMPLCRRAWAVFGAPQERIKSPGTKGCGIGASLQVLVLLLCVFKLCSQLLKLGVPLPLLCSLMDPRLQ